MTDTNYHFHAFSHLPIELRLKIWSFALSDTRRVVYIECEKGTQLGNTRYVKSFASTSQVPVLMRVNRESRYEALAIYRPFFRTNHRPTGIYVAFDRDTIVFPDGIISYLKEAELQGIQSMILELADVAYFGHFNIDILRSMRGLKTLELRVENTGAPNWSNEDPMSTLANDLREEGVLHPEWDMPLIKLVSKHTDAVVMLDREWT